MDEFCERDRYYISKYNINNIELKIEINFLKNKMKNENKKIT